MNFIQIQKNWRERAIDLYYNQKKDIPDIIRLLGEDKANVSRVIRDHDYKTYCEEKERRRELKRQIKHKEKEEAKKERKRKHEKLKAEPKRKTNSNGTMKEVLQQVHDQDVKILSRNDRRGGPGILQSMDYYRSAYEYSNNTYIRKEKTQNQALVPTTLPRVVNADIDFGIDTFTGGKRLSKGGSNRRRQALSTAINNLK